MHKRNELKLKNTIRTKYLQNNKNNHNTIKHDFKIHWIFSQEKHDNCLEGRINKDNLETLALNFENSADYYICGPGEFIDNAENFLQVNGVKSSSIYFERFTAKVKKKNTDNSDKI